MQLRFKVHSVAQDKVPVVARVDGVKEPIEALADGIVVELIAADGSGTSQTIREVPADLAAALALFKPGAEIVASYAAAK